MYEYRLRLDRTPISIPEGCCNSVELAHSYIWELVKEEPFELMGALFMNNAGMIQGQYIAFRGTMTRMVVDPKPFILAALLSNSPSIILFHNHPSGSCEPSFEDSAFTKRMIRACELVGLTLADHIIVADKNSSYSFKRRSPEMWNNL